MIRFFLAKIVQVRNETAGADYGDATAQAENGEKRRAVFFDPSGYLGEKGLI